MSYSGIKKMDSIHLLYSQANYLQDYLNFPGVFSYYNTAIYK